MKGCAPQQGLGQVPCCPLYSLGHFISVLETTHVRVLGEIWASFATEGLKDGGSGPRGAGGTGEVRQLVLW